MSQKTFGGGSKENESDLEPGGAILAPSASRSDTSSCPHALEGEADVQPPRPRTNSMRIYAVAVFTPRRHAGQAVVVHHMPGRQPCYASARRPVIVETNA